jgi:geranylgeranyl pyrophosphate synthase
MDKSLAKESKLTVFGKFGKDIAILAGDVLLLKGIYLLHEACKTLPKQADENIFDIIKSAFFEMSSGVAKEASLRGTTSIPLDEFLSIVRQKVSTAEATMKIGAIIGNGTPQEIVMLAHFGRTYGVLLSLRDEFVDVFEPEEVKNRLENESLPIPILLALQDETKNKQLLEVLKNKDITENIEKILDLSIDCQASKELIAYMKKMVAEEIENLTSIRNNKEIFTLLMKSTVEDL